MSDTTGGDGKEVVAGTKIGSVQWLRGGRTTSLQTMLQQMCQSCAVERCVQTYLETAEYSRMTWQMPLLLGNILIYALEPFLSEEGIAIEGAVNDGELSENVIAPAATRLIRLSPDVCTDVPSEGLLFLHFSDDRRAIIKIDRIPCSSDITFELYMTTGRPEAFVESWKKYARKHAYLRGQCFYASGEFIRMDPAVRLKDVYMPAETQCLVERLVLRFSEKIELFRRKGLSMKRGVLLAGQPGTGKSMLCRALCSELKATFIWVTARHACADADHIVAVWDLARMLQPTVILLEDIDLFAESRDFTCDSSILGELMNQMDGPQSNEGILTIATTNRLSVVEKALRNRPGRFDRVIHFDPLDEDARNDLLAKYLAAESPEIGTFERLVRETEGYTGAQLVDLARTILEILAEYDADEPINRDGLIEEAMDRAVEEVGSRMKKRKIGFNCE